MIFCTHNPKSNNQNVVFIAYDVLIGCFFRIRVQNVLLPCDLDFYLSCSCDIHVTPLFSVILNSGINISFFNIQFDFDKY